MVLPGEDGGIRMHLRNIRYRYDGMGRLISEAEGGRSAHTTMICAGTVWRRKAGMEGSVMITTGRTSL